MKRFVTILSLLLFGAAVLFCQEYRGTIGGNVLDATGALIGGAKVTITETKTGTKIETISDGAGHYAAPFLTPGDYQVVVHVDGFKEFVRKDIHLGAGDRIGINARMEVGEAVQTVEVTGEVPMVNGESATVGQAITTKEVEDLPLNGRTPMVLASLSLGVLATGQPSLIHPFDSGAGSAWSIGGTP